MLNVVASRRWGRGALLVPGGLSCSRLGKCGGHGGGAVL